MAGAAYGVPVRLTVRYDLIDAVRTMLPAGWRDRPVLADAPTWTVSEAYEIDSLRAELELHVAEHAPGLVFLHAGVVAVDGRALLLPGRSMSGKSSLTEVLVRAGAAYYSDEFAVLDADGMVVPYPRPLALRATADSPARRLTATELGEPATGPATPTLVGHLRYDEALGWDVQPMARGAMALALIDNAVAAQSRTAEVLTRCAAVAALAQGVSGTRGDKDEAAKRLLEWMRP